MPSQVLLQRLHKFLAAVQGSAGNDVRAVLGIEEQAASDSTLFDWTEWIAGAISKVRVQLDSWLLGEGWNVDDGIPDEYAGRAGEIQRLLLEESTVRNFFIRTLNRFQASQAGRDGFTPSEMTELRQEAVEIFERILTGTLAGWIARSAPLPVGKPVVEEKKPETGPEPATAPKPAPPEPKTGKFETAALVEIREAVHAIGALSGKLRANIAPGGEDSLGGILKNLQRISSLLESLGLSQTPPAAPPSEPIRIAPISTRAFMDSLAEAFRPLAEHKGLRLAMSCDPTLTSVETDAPKLYRAISLLLGNAVQYTEEGGVSLVARAAGLDWMLTVEDTGPGIHPEKISDHLSVVAFNSERTPHGISVAQGLIHLLGGHLDIDSVPRRGTRVAVCLPRARKAR